MKIITGKPMTDKLNTAIKDRERDGILRIILEPEEWSQLKIENPDFSFSRDLWQGKYRIT